MDKEMDYDEQEMYEKLYSLIGARVKIGCDQTFYIGIVDKVFVPSRTVTLRHTKFPDGEYLGNIHFRFSEIASLSVVEPKEVASRYPRFDYLRDVILNSKARKKYTINELLFDGQLSDVSDDEEDEEFTDKDEESTEEFVLEVPPHLKAKLPNDSIIIDSFDDNFTQAVEDISKQKIIGVSFDGPNISRFNRLTSVCISTSSCVYLFDIEQLQYDAFDSGLRDILEEKSIKKVIHDCRFPSDCLARRYGTQLTNVFDTQVADFIINMQRYNDKYEYKFVSSLDLCLRNHLDVLPEFLCRRAKSDNKVDYHTKRPICNAFRYDLIKDALYLLVLQKKLASMLLDPLHKNVGVYLGVIANASQEEIYTLGNELSPPDELPPAILMYGIQTVQFHKPRGEKPVSLKCKFLNPQNGQIISFEEHPSKNMTSDSNGRTSAEEEILKKFGKIMQKKKSIQQMKEETSCKEVRTPVEEEILKKFSNLQGKSILQMKQEEETSSSEVRTSTDEEILKKFRNLKKKSISERMLKQQENNSNSLLAEDTSSTSDTSDEMVDTFTMAPSLRHMDEVYHRCVNNLYFRSGNAANVINVKPDYISKITVRKPFDYSSEQSSTTKTDSDAAPFVDWASFYEAPNLSSLKQNGRNIRFVPA